MRRRVFSAGTVLLGTLGLIWACGFDDALREYLDAHFWLPFVKGPIVAEKPGVRRISAPFAGMAAADGDSPLARLRAAYHEISEPDLREFDPARQRQMLAAARTDSALTPEEKEEVELIDAKIDMRAGEPDNTELLNHAKEKLEAFLRTARTPAVCSEARGWLAHVQYLLGDQTAAGKIYLDELNRSGSNLSRETVLNSLRMTYGYDGGAKLLAHLEEYFDTPDHAAFAIQLITNPRWDRGAKRFREPGRTANADAQVLALLAEHRRLLRSSQGANTLALLAMRTQLHVGDPVAARKTAEAVPARAQIRSNPDFRWMLASACFLSREYAKAEAPLLALFRSSRRDDSRKAAAAYALCGVYRKTGNILEQLRFALWLNTAVREQDRYLSNPSRIEDLTVYWAVSGWDINMLLDAEAGIDALRSFIEQNSGVPDIWLVKYSLAVRLARDDCYEDAADIYGSLNAMRRAQRMRRLAALYRETHRGELNKTQQQECWYQVADFIRANPNRLYFNDALWSGLQRYSFQQDAADTRLTRAERESQQDLRRKLQDDQEERWRAYLILRKIVQDGADPEIQRRAIQLALRCLRGINTDRFGREEEINAAEIELSARLRRLHATTPAHANTQPQR
jgi:hypothetical protein